MPVPNGKEEKHRMKAAAYIITAGGLWGVISIFIRVLNDLGLNSLQCVAVRAGFTALLLLVWLLLTDRAKLAIRLSDLPFFAGTGLMSIVFFNFCYFEAIQVLGSAAVPALLLYTAPVFVMLLSALFFREKITRAKVIALLVTCGGLCLVTEAFQDGAAVSLRGVLLGLGAGLGYSLYSIFGKYLVKKYHSVTITFYTFAVAAVGVIPLSGIAGCASRLAQPSALPAALGLALICTVLPFLLYTKGLAALDAGKASILATAEPLTAAVVGAVVFHEQFSLSRLAGIALILAAIVYLNLAGGESAED